MRTRNFPMRQIFSSYLSRVCTFTYTSTTSFHSSHLRIFPKSHTLCCIIFWLSLNGKLNLASFISVHTRISSNEWSVTKKPVLLQFHIKLRPLSRDFSHLKKHASNKFASIATCDYLNFRHFEKKTRWKSDVRQVSIDVGDCYCKSPWLNHMLEIQGSLSKRVNAIFIEWWILLTIVVDSLCNSILGIDMGFKWIVIMSFDISYDCACLLHHFHHPFRCSGDLYYIYSVLHEHPLVHIRPFYCQDASWVAPHEYRVCNECPFEMALFILKIHNSSDQSERSLWNSCLTWYYLFGPIL